MTVNQMSVIRRPVHHPRTASRIFGQDAVIISPAENVVRMLNPTGSRVWQLADGTRTVDEIAAILAQEFAVTTAEALASTEEFVATLVAKDLLTWAE